MTKEYQQALTLQEHLWFKARIKRGSFFQREIDMNCLTVGISKKLGLFKSELSQDDSL